MYKQFTKDEYKKRFGFPLEYEVEGVLVYGTFKKRYYDVLKDAVSNLNLDVQYRFIEHDFLSPILEIKVGDKNYWFMISYGGAMLSEHLHIASVFGSKKNILLGSCGGLTKEANASDIIFPVEVFSEESSAKMYSESKSNLHYPDLNLVKKLQSGFENKFKYFEGKTVTCQAMLGESWEDVLNWSNDGCIGVEMEAGTVFSVSKHFNIPSAAILVIADNLIKEETIWDEEHKDRESLRRQVQKAMFEVGVKELLNIN